MPGWGGARHSICFYLQCAPFDAGIENDWEKRSRKKESKWRNRAWYTYVPSTYPSSFCLLSLCKILITVNLFWQTHRNRFHVSHQSLDATMLSDRPAGPSELGHIGDGLCSQALQLFVRRVQDGHHGLQTTQISDGLPNLRVTTDLLQDLQRTNLTARESKV